MHHHTSVRIIMETFKRARYNYDNVDGTKCVSTALVKPPDQKVHPSPLRDSPRPRGDEKLCSLSGMKGDQYTA